MNDKLAIITARSGSKRIPAKNIKPFLGKPIIAYPIKSALDSGLFKNVIVSTDSRQIAIIAREYGADVPFMRSAKNSDDHATTYDVLEEVIQEYHRRFGMIDEACCLYPTSPFITPQRLIEAYNIFKEKLYDTLFPVVRYESPIERALDMIDGKITMILPENIKRRTQDCVPAYRDSGQFYWFNVNAVMKKKTLYTDNTGGFEIPAMETHDIDTAEDWEIAEYKYEWHKSRRV